MQPILSIDSITFEWSESANVAEGTVVKTVAEADAILAAIRTDAPAGGAYDKTSIVLAYTTIDGETGTYQGRWDVQRDGTDSSILGHFKAIAETAGSRPELVSLYGNLAVAAARFVDFIEHGAPEPPPAADAFELVRTGIERALDRARVAADDMAEVRHEAAEALQVGAVQATLANAIAALTAADALCAALGAARELPATAEPAAAPARA